MCRENDIFGIVGAFSDDPEKPRYLTSFEVLRVEEEVRTVNDIQDGKPIRVDRPYVAILFRPRMWLPKLHLKAESTFYANSWASPGYSFSDLFPIHGSEYYGFQDDEVSQPGWRSQMDGTLYSTLADARADCGKRYRGIAIAELWPIVLTSRE